MTVKKGASKKPHDGRRDRKVEIANLVTVEPGTLGSYALEYLERLRMQNYSPMTVKGREAHLRYFLVWCHERGLARPDEITVAVVESYQRALFRQRKRTGEPLSFRSQRDRLLSVRRFFRWLAKTRVIEMSPAELLDMPRIEQRLPRAVLSVDEVEKVLAVPDVTTPMGIRDRAVLETLYSTGVRRSEIVALKLWDIDFNGGVLTVRQGKGKKDRMIPIGERALRWIMKYRDEVRPHLVVGDDDGTLFLTRLCEPFSSITMAELARKAIDASGIGKTGSCHLFRHTCATLMLEGGADLRYIQAMLGHASIASTQLYTRVAVRKLKRVHELTHPGANLKRREARDEGRESLTEDELLSSLAAEAAEEDDEERSADERRKPEESLEKSRSTWFIRQ